MTATGDPTVPEHWPRLFTERLNAGDLDGVLELYAANARLVTPTRDVLVGHDRIRVVVAGLIAARVRLAGTVVHTPPSWTTSPSCTRIFGAP